jgi:hypothetical protein
MTNSYAYIDGQNLHFGVKSMGWKLDHRKFRTYLSEVHGVSRAYIFLGFMEEHQDLYNVLQEAGFICHFKPLVRHDDGVIKGNVDADLVLQAMIDIERYDNAVIVSGDGDFSGLLRHLISRNKLGKIIIPNREKYSSLFDRLEGFDSRHVVFMNDLRNDLSYGDIRRPFPNSRRPRKDPPATAPVQEVTPKSPAPGKQSRVQSTKTAQNENSKPQRYQTNKRPAQKHDRAKQPKNQPQNTFKSKADLERSLIDTIDQQ